MIEKKKELDSEIMDGERIDEIFARIDLWGMDVRTNIFTKMY